MPNHHVYDVETLSNCSIFIFEHYKDQNIQKVFVIHELRNDFTELVDFLENAVDNGEWFIGFNCLSFDSQLLEMLIRSRKSLEGLSAGEIAAAIYKKAQTIIQNQDGGFGNRDDYPEWKLSTKQIDVFKMNHWDNPAKRSSLKWIQNNMDWYNIQEMPIHHSTRITTIEQIEIIISYCVNDVRSTREAFNRSRKLLEVRQMVTQRYKLKCYNWSNTKLGSELLLKMYCEKTGKKRIDVKTTGTTRAEVKVADILFPYINFKTIEFTQLYLKFKSTIVKNTKGEFKHSVVFRGLRFDYGLGGMHQCIAPGAYHSDEEWVIEDIDVSGLYPNIACVNGMYPAHLGPEFYQVYKDEIVDVRMTEKAKGKLGDKAIIEGYKEAANASFGNSNNEHSWLRDSQYLLQTTVNGELMITMLVEVLMLGLEGCVVLQTNTDGLTLRFKRSDQDKFKIICKEWEEVMKFKLEFAKYKSMFVWDVNNYSAVYEDSSKLDKLKGRFDFMDLALHKNKSFLIVPKAIHAFLVKGIPPERYLQENRNIFDYCGVSRVGSDWKFYGTCVVDGVVQQTPLQKVVRFYVSNKGCKIVKINKSDNRRINVVAGTYLQTEMNLYQELPFDQYDVNDQFYLDRIYQEIGNLNGNKIVNQLELF